jgi:hypothetical protein
MELLYKYCFPESVPDDLTIMEERWIVKINVSIEVVRAGEEKTSTFAQSGLTIGDDEV